MNRPPATFIRVPHQALHAFVTRASQTVGLPPEKAELLAGLLVANDLRGVFSHGTTQIATYAILMRDGQLNASPDVRVVRETPVSVIVDGDGGLGYFPAYEGTLRAIAKARAQGIAVMQSRNHGHFGAAGIYTRLTLEHDLLTFVTSGHQLKLAVAGPPTSAAGGSPMSFCAPAEREDPLVVDFGAIHDMYPNSPNLNELARLAPGTVFRSIGLGGICQAWGGFLAGVPVDEARAARTYPGANQGALLITVQIGLFIDPARFKSEMDAYARHVCRLSPLEGFERSQLAGVPEAERERAYRAEGVPVGPEHQRRLEGLAAEFGIAVPWR
ncbi:MAG: Ldh family oxidoreductase [Actinobacteria bacterium]|nr:Ldh family oxidoreductase [Actinomycetota bacterium]